MAKTILIADDDPTQRRLLQAAVERQGFLTIQAEDGSRAIAASNNCDLVLLDLVMPGVTGMEALQAINANRPELPVIVLTGHGGVDTAVQAMQAGAVDFLIKPASPERIMVSVRNALKVTELQTEVKRLVKKQDGVLGFDDMIAGAPSMRQVVRLGQRAAQSDIPVLILGESGAGKELIARSIQAASARAGKPFISVNCGAIPENLVESILFGHEKGSFTGAHEKHLGKFLEANGGTLFLDEVGELPLDMQVKLLRVLQEGEVDPVGSKRPVKVNVRIISATNKDLPTLIEEGRFREDLYYRLNVYPIESPPLRQRREDIPALVNRFIARFNSEEGKSIEGASAQAMAMLSAFDWPGNVRQLENTVFRAVVLCDGKELQLEDFPQISGNVPIFLELPAGPTPGDVVEAAFDAREKAMAAAAAFEAPVGVIDEKGDIRPLVDIERDLIAYAIDVYAGHMSEVARRLGIGRSTLYRKLKEYDLEDRLQSVA